MQPHIMVVGTGAIGGTLGAYLHRAGRNTTLVDPWFTHVERVRRDGLRVESPDEDFRVHPRLLHVDQLDQVEREVDVLVIAVKAYDTEWAYRLAAPYLSPEAAVLCAQNGVVEDHIVRYVAPERIVGCVVSVAAEIFEPGFVRRTLAGEWPTLTLGELAGPGISERVTRLQELFAPAGDIRANQDIMGELWSKLALNAMTNGTGALTGATTRTLWGDDRFLPVAVSAAAETAAVADAAGVRIEPVFGRIPIPTLLATYAGDGDASAEVADILRTIAQERTGARENKPSMLQDHLKGRRTEIDYINGYVVDHANRLGMEAPTNGRITDLVRALERGDLVQSLDNVDALRASGTGA